MDPITRTASASPVSQLVERTPPVSAPAPVAKAAAQTDADTAPAKAQASPVGKPAPLSVDVTQSEGVFVYTLRDPATDTVIAVIPREAVRAGRDGRNVDQSV